MNGTMNRPMTANRAVTVAAALLLLAACETSPVSETTVNRVLKAPELPNAPYTSIVIVGATPYREADRMVEEGLRDTLRRRGVDAFSFVRLSAATKPSDEAVEALVDETGADAVLVVTARLEGVAVERREQRVDVEPRVRGGNLFDFFRYDYREITSPAREDVTVDAVFVSDLYDVESERRVYSVESATARGLTSYDIVMDESEAIVRRLAKDGLIP